MNSNTGIPFHLLSPSRLSLYAGCDRSKLPTAKHAAALYLVRA